MASCMRMLENMTTGGSSGQQQPTGPAAPYALALWNLVIRPPRARYQLSELGPPIFELDGIKGRRHDMRLRTDRGLHLECSYYRPEPASTSTKARNERLPVVIYLHGNSSSRLEALDVLKPLLTRRISLFCYDAAGCGKSEGEYVSLGHFESEDLACVIRHLQSSPGCGPIGLWGRSMGAATALLHSDVTRAVGAICSDSAFASLPEVMWDLGTSEHHSLRCPPWLLTGVLAVVRMRVQALAGFDVEEVAPLQQVGRRSVPAIFVHARKDNFIPVHHSRRLYEAYAGAKEFIEIGGDHNSPRGPRIIECVVDFFARVLRKSISASGKRPAPVKTEGSNSALHWEITVPRAALAGPSSGSRERSERRHRKSAPAAITPSKEPSPRERRTPPPQPAMGRRPAPAVAPPLKHLDLLREPSIAMSDGWPGFSPSPARHANPVPPARKPAAAALELVPGLALQVDAPAAAFAEATPRTMPPRGGGARNPSPWEPCFGDEVYNDEPRSADLYAAIYKDEDPKGPPASTSDRGPLLELGMILAEVAEGRSADAKAGRALEDLRHSEEQGKENLGPPPQPVAAATAHSKPVRATIDRAIDRAAATATGPQAMELLKDLERRSLPREGIEVAPLCRLPTAATLPDLATPEVSSSAYPPTPGVADDPEVRPMPSSAEPSLLTSCSGPAVGLAILEDVDWWQPRHCLRHPSTMSTPDSKAPRKPTAGRNLAAQPWLCCGFTPVST